MFDLPTSIDPRDGRDPRRLVVVACVVAVLSGCTSLQTSPLEPAQLRSAIRDGSLIEPGEDVWLTTQDGKVHAFKVTSVDVDLVRGALLGGEPVEVPIDDIVSLRTVELQPAQSALAGLGIYYLAGTAIVMAMVVDDL
ncbi:MAG: hypothetical protein F4X98_17015 [Gammaproteobacteria bacterium]|nr:hypothetical protein [Gammaproteobacteria bacterium]